MTAQAEQRAARFRTCRHRECGHIRHGWSREEPRIRATETRNDRAAAVVIEPGNILYAPGVRAGRWVFATGHKGTADFGTMKARILLAHMLAGLALLAPLGASAQPDAPPWKFSVMPYLWVPSVDGKLNDGPPPAGGGSANVSVDADTLLGDLNFAFMITGEARKGRWFVATDVIYRGSTLLSPFPPAREELSAGFVR